MKRTPVNAERANLRDIRLSRWRRESGSQGIRPIGRIMMHHGKRVENYTLPKRPTLFVLRRARNVAFWPRKGKASLVIEAHRAWCKTAEIQRRRDGMCMCKPYTYLPTATYGILPFRRDGKPIPMLCPMCSPRAHDSCASNSVLLAEEMDNVSTEIIISPRITREKIYPACICACVLYRASFP